MFGSRGAMQAAVIHDCHKMSVWIGKLCISGIFWIICPFPLVGLQENTQLQYWKGRKETARNLHTSLLFHCMDQYLKGWFTEKNTSAELLDLKTRGSGGWGGLHWGQFYRHSLFPSPALNLHLWAWVKRQHGNGENAPSSSVSTADHFCVCLSSSTFLSLTVPCEKRRKWIYRNDR